MSLSFSGRLSRGGWILRIIAAVTAGFGALFFVVMNESEVARSLRHLAVLVIPSVVVLSVLAASVRRLRDAGSPTPFLELAIGLLLPVVGWAYLLSRLLLTGSAGGRRQSRKKRSDNAYSTQTRQETAAAQKTADRATTTARDSKPTVVRVGRKTLIPARRMIGF